MLWASCNGESGWCMVAICFLSKSRMMYECKVATSIVGRCGMSALVHRAWHINNGQQQLLGCILGSLAQVYD